MDGLHQERAREHAGMRYDSVRPPGALRSRREAPALPVTPFASSRPPLAVFCLA
jgi:hypothetical protein